jgi:hypothetical protein
VTLADVPTIDWETYPVLRVSRLTGNEQLSLFAMDEEVCSRGARPGQWALLGLAAVILPWILIGWMIWALT